MSKISNGFFGLLAVSTAFGVTQFASGSDLGSDSVQTLKDAIENESVVTVVNRDAKSDQSEIVKTSSGSPQTLTFQLRGGSNISFLVRLPAVSAPIETARSNPSLNSVQPATRRHALLACEPVVSILTSIAKQLPSGRCVT